MATNTPCLTNLFRLQGAIEEAGVPVSDAIDHLLSDLDSGEPITEAHLGIILLRIAQMRQLLTKTEKQVLRAHAQRDLVWSYEA